MSYRPKDTTERILHRLKIADGHLKKVINMVELDEYCIDVINQSKAVQRALAEVDNLLMEQHLKNCVVDHIKKGQTQSTIEEIMNIFKRG